LGAPGRGLSDEVGPIVLTEPTRPVPVLGAVVSGASVAVACWLQAALGAERAVELGAGRGLVGFSLASLGIPTVLTDIEPAVCSALRESIGACAVEGGDAGGGADAARPAAALAELAEVRQLDWDDGLEGLNLGCTSGLLVGAELLWADDAVDSLWEAVSPLVLEQDWELVYGASMRPSNALFLDRLGAEEDAELSREGRLVMRPCCECGGWRTAEECVVAHWQRKGGGAASRLAAG